MCACVANAALEALCAVVHTEADLACSAPFANVALPPGEQTRRHGTRPTRGVVDWFEALAPRMPSVDILSADLAAQNSTSGDPPIFDMQWDMLADMNVSTAPFIVSSYGIDAYNSNAWFASAGHAVVAKCGH